MGCRPLLHTKVAGVLYDYKLIMSHSRALYCTVVCSAVEFCWGELSDNFFTIYTVWYAVQWNLHTGMKQFDLEPLSRS